MAYFWSDSPFAKTLMGANKDKASPTFSADSRNVNIYNNKKQR